MAMSEADYEAWRSAQTFEPLSDRALARSRQFFQTIAALHIGAVACMTDYTHTWLERGMYVASQLTPAGFDGDAQTYNCHCNSSQLVPLYGTTGAGQGCQRPASYCAVSKNC